MESNRFDALARSWGRGTRRRTLQQLAGSSLGAALLGVLGLEDAAAGCVAPGKKCKKKKGKKKKCCGGAKCQGKKCKCTNGGIGCGKACCEPGQVCQDGLCANGSIPVGALCDAAQPGACTSGVCGCICSGESCICRQEACLAALGNYNVGGNAACCQGFCLSGDPDSCQVC